LSDGLKHAFESGVVLGLQVMDSLLKISMRGQHLWQPHEGPHDFDVYQHGPSAREHAGKHGHALFRESV